MCRHNADRGIGHAWPEGDRRAQAQGGDEPRKYPLERPIPVSPVPGDLGDCEVEQGRRAVLVRALAPGRFRVSVCPRCPHSPMLSARGPNGPSPHVA
jgi:hypothetical protein